MVTPLPLTSTVISADALYPLTEAPLPEYVTVTIRVKVVPAISSSEALSPVEEKVQVPAPSSALLVTVSV